MNNIGKVILERRIILNIKIYNINQKLLKKKHVLFIHKEAKLIKQRKILAEIRYFW